MTSDERKALETALDALGGMWSWNDAYLDDERNAHLWAVSAGRILRSLVGRPARKPDDFLAKAGAPCRDDESCWLNHGHRGPHEHIVDGRSVPV